MARRSLPRIAALATTAVPLPRLPSQSDANGKMSAWKTPAHSSQPSPSAPVPLMASAVQQDPTAMEPSFCPPSITSTPLGLGGSRQWQTTSDESRHSLASIYTNPGFNLPGYPPAGPGNLTPTVPR